MTMPTALQARARTSPVIWSCMRLLFLAVCVAMVNQPALVKAGRPDPPSTIVLYFRLNEHAGRSGNAGGISSFNTIARDGPDEDSTVVGQSVGEVIVARDGSKLLVFTYELDIPGRYSGSVSGQGIVNSIGSGEAAITGGTAHFLGVFGYFDIDVVKPGVLLKSTLHVQFLPEKILGM